MKTERFNFKVPDINCSMNMKIYGISHEFFVRAQKKLD